MSSPLFRPGLSGCSDGGCIIRDNSVGMHTNGGCNCARELSRHNVGREAYQTILWLRSELSTRLQSDPSQGGKS